MENLERKTLRYSKKDLIISVCIMVGFIVFILIAAIPDSNFMFEIISDKVYALILIVVLACFIGALIYQYYNNILEYGSCGFIFKDVTYSYSQVTKLVTGRRGRYGTYYHIYVGDEIIYRFSAAYENKDDFIMTLQKNGVLIVA